MKAPLVATLQDFRRILGMCPCCGEVFRLTDLMIAYRAKPTVTWLDRLEADEDRQQRAEDKFAEDEKRIRELAKERGRRALPRLLREAEPVFACRGYFAHDVKPHPGRVFMALAAAHFLTGEEPAEREATPRLN